MTEKKTDDISKTTEGMARTGTDSPKETVGGAGIIDSREWSSSPTRP